VVQGLIDARANPIGKNNLDQFATGLAGGGRSPYEACSPQTAWCRPAAPSNAVSIFALNSWDASQVFQVAARLLYEGPWVTERYLADGSRVTGFLCEPYILGESPYITRLGGWRRFWAEGG
jgi:hypothetical protein